METNDIFNYEMLPDRDDLLDAIESICWYNGYGDALKELLDYLNENVDKDSYYIPCPFDELSNIWETIQPIWMILVCLYGDYGTSPRSGWIEKKHFASARNLVLYLMKTFIEDEMEV